MDDTAAKALKAILAVLDVADTNFPRDCEVQISAVGSNTASVKLPTYAVRQALKIKVT